MPINSGEKVFTSWKEIACFFGKGVRTVQRWERKFGLPISRPTAARNVVLATESELRDWIRRASSQLVHDDAAQLRPTENEPSATEISLRLKALEDDTARLAQVVARFTERVEELSLRMNAAPIEPTATLLKKNGSKSLDSVGDQ